MAEYLIQDSSLTGIANAIRAKNGGTEALTIEKMISAIASISGGGLEAEEFQIASDMINAQEVIQSFKKLMDESATINIFMLSGDASTSGINNKMQLFILTKYNGNAGYYVRWRSGAWDAQSNNASSYDLAVSAGDVFSRVVIV